MRTRASVCQRKRRFVSAAEALASALNHGSNLRPYRCDRCGRFHLTSRTKGKFIGAAGRHDGVRD